MLRKDYSDKSWLNEHKKLNNPETFLEALFVGLCMVALFVATAALLTILSCLKKETR